MINKKLLEAKEKYDKAKKYRVCMFMDCELVDHDFFFMPICNKLCKIYTWEEAKLSLRDFDTPKGLYYVTAVDILGLMA